MHCAYCGNAYHGQAARCEGCGSPRSARAEPAYRDADALYAEVGHALITGEPNKSRALLEKIIGSPETAPKRLMTERIVKVSMVIGLIYLFPTVALVLATMAMPFIIMIYLPYLGIKRLICWISSDPARH